MTAGRKPTPPVASKATPINEALVRADFNTVATLGAQEQAHLNALAQQLRYEGSLLPDALENGAREACRRISMALFELGGYLLLLRETCEHGNFVQRLARLGLEPRVAQQYMQVTRRFSNANSNSHLEALGKTKLLEMLVLDNEEIDELVLTGQTGELSLDDVATMSVKELRSALRESRQEKSAVEQVLADKNKRIDQLKAAQKRIQAAPPDQVLADLQKEATSHMHDASGLLRGTMRQALIALNNATTERGSADMQVFMAGLVGQLVADLAALREEFSLPDVSNAAELQSLAESAQWFGPAK